MSGKFNAELDPLGGGVANKEPPLGVQQVQNPLPNHAKRNHRRSLMILNLSFLERRPTKVTP